VKWIKSFPLPKRKNNRNRLGYAILKKDSESEAMYWFTTNGDGKDEMDLAINSNLIIPTTLFKEGTVVEIYMEDRK
jgi:hypothetical protein